jgi:transcriptional regulator with XRE-family HTH domain
MARAVISPPRPVPRFGSRLRAARRDRGLTTRQVAEAAGVTKGFVAQIERDETSPSVATLLRMCDALGIEVGSLFESPRSDLVRVADRTQIDFGGSGVTDWLLSPNPDVPLHVLYSEIEPGGGGGEEAYTLSADHEFVFVIAGSVRVTVGDITQILGPGDAMTFSPREPHTWANASETEPATVLWVMSPSPYGRR